MVTLGKYLVLSSLVWTAFMGCKHAEDSSQLRADTSGLVAPAMSDKQVKIDRQPILDP